jgi:hypothetical protein
LGKRRRDSSYRFSWGELDHKFVGVALKLYCYEEPGLMLAVGWPRFFITLPQNALTRRLFGSEMDYLGLERPTYGFSFSLRGEWAFELHTYWGTKSKWFYPPWGWNKRRDDYLREYLTDDERWLPYAVMPRSYDATRQGAPAWKAEWPFHYMTSDGEAQHVTATVTRNRTRSIYRIFGIPVRRRVKHTIEVEFSEEVGNQRGSWKGGVVGCGEEMRPGEHPRATLQRMQRRNFDR